MFLNFVAFSCRKMANPKSTRCLPSKRQPIRDVRGKFFIVTFEKQHTILCLESFANIFLSLLPFPKIFKHYIQHSSYPHFPACESNRISDGIEIETSRLFACLPSGTRSFFMQKEWIEGRECFIELKIITRCFVVS